MLLDLCDGGKLDHCGFGVEGHGRAWVMTGFMAMPGQVTALDLAFDAG